MHSLVNRHACANYSLKGGFADHRSINCIYFKLGLLLNFIALKYFDSNKFKRVLKYKPNLFVDILHFLDLFF